MDGADVRRGLGSKHDERWKYESHGSVTWRSAASSSSLACFRTCTLLKALKVLSRSDETLERAANEVSEKLAVVGFSANMISYLTQQLHMPLTKAANTLTNFGGTASLTPLLGAFLADAFVGRFWIIAVGSIFYQIVNLRWSFLR
ncbi:hypothetical protein BHM03_00048305 [Ensete ventricosum]|nr:hypothetical protein BHM03_00048305 [Ensete ventricosum]